MLPEQYVVLKQETVARVWIDDQLGVRQMLRQNDRIHSRDDQVIAPAGDQGRVRDFLQMGVCRVLVTIPPGQGRALRFYAGARERRIAFAYARLELLPVSHAGRLTRFGRFKKELEKPVRDGGNAAASRAL